MYHKYQRHYLIFAVLYDMLKEALIKFKDYHATIKLTGSGVCWWLSGLVAFVQEVVASSEAVRRLIPQTNVAIELGEKTQNNVF